MERRKVIFLLCGGLHILFIVVVSLRDTAAILSEGGNLLPRSLDNHWAYTAKMASKTIGQRLDDTNPLRRGVTAYLHAAGIEAGYAFFAPNVPSTYKLVFELHYPDRPVGYVLPEVRSTAAGLRLVSLFDRLGRTTYPPLREMIFRMIARSTQHAHPDAITIRTVFGYVEVPSPEGYRRGERDYYEFLYAYDFHFEHRVAKHGKD